jgi:hypothetical protein
MNDAFIALQRRDELSDTLFFCGLSNACTRELVRGKKAYIFKTEKLCLTISGRSIIIDGKKVGSVYEAKRVIAERTL